MLMMPHLAVLVGKTQSNMSIPRATHTTMSTCSKHFSNSTVVTFLETITYVSNLLGMNQISGLLISPVSVSDRKQIWLAVYRIGYKFRPGSSSESSLSYGTGTEHINIFSIFQEITIYFVWPRESNLYDSNYEAERQWGWNYKVV